MNYLFEKEMQEISQEVKQKNLLKTFLMRSLIELQKILDSMNEAEEPEVYRGKVGRALTVQEKRDMLKNIYKKMLEKKGKLEDYRIFAKMIDNSPEDYLDYELRIDHENASEMIDDFREGDVPLTIDQFEIFKDLFQGIGKPALERHGFGARRREKLDPRAAQFGADELSKGAREYNRIKKETESMPTAMKYGMPATNAPMIPPEARKKIRRNLQNMFNIDVNPEIANILGGLKASTKKRDIESDVMGIMLKSGNKENAKQEMERQGLLDYIETENFEDLWNFASKEKEKVRVRRK
jgi:hypothetical protein